ncbi:MAG TPA: GMC family oxidoreductase [Solirubrobacteraceae bacterium]|nr:GMC family oxidoreductase [Solirubrobacteraceae bacterium]
MSAAAIRATGSEAYRDGSGTFHPPERRIVRGAELERDRTIEVDACVIGSGAGGAPVAKELAEGGMRVAILEEGDWWETDEFTARPREMTLKLYRDAGQTTTVGRPPILLPLGRAVGGTTLINSGTCFRTPASVLEAWRHEAGLEALTEEELEPYFRRVERLLNVAQVPPELAGHNAEVVRRGVEKLGWSGDYLYRNARGCVGSGVCAFGCPTGAKQHVGITYVPRAWAAGATTYTGVRAERIERAGRRVTGVLARTAAGAALRVRCEHAVIACGALQTPLFLRRQGIGGESGMLGRNLSIHPATVVRALFDEPIEMWRGVPQSYYVDELAEERVMLEGAAGPPDYIAASIGRAGAEHRALMERFANLAQFGVMVSDVSRGEVRELFGRPLVRYDLEQADVRAFERGLAALVEIYWAAGAREVILPVARIGTLRGGDSAPLTAARLRAGELGLMAFHPLGTARAGADPARSVVDSDGRVHGFEGLYVADGAAVPSALGVNPQITIMALATRLAYRLLGSAPPSDEPAPERMARPRVAAAH